LNGALECRLISWREIHRLGLKIAGRIREQSWRPDLVVAIARGGFTPARILCDALHVDTLTSIALKHYRPGGVSEQRVCIKDPLSITIHRRSVLLVDDVNDSGETLNLAVDYLDSWRPASLRVAVLHHKTSSRFRPHFHGTRVIHWRWLVYPWALCEDVGSFIARMEPVPETPAEAAQRLRAIHGIRVDESMLSSIMAAGK
jgi:hypoxanthine phosphoribosyltransferase